MESEKPEPLVIEDSLVTKNLIFTFILDCSGSMGGSRIHLAKEALTLFIRSLPKGSKFEIIRFGTKYEYLNINGKSKAIEYNEETSNQAILAIEDFNSDFGGTNILSPLKDAVTLSFTQSLVNFFGFK